MNHLINSVINWVKSNPLFALIAVAALIFVLIWFKDSIGGQIEKVNRRLHDKAIAAEQAEIERLKDENDKLLQEAKTAFALGEAKGLEADALYAELAKYGKAAQAAAEAQKKASDEYEKELATISVDVPLLDRCRALCSERATVGYPCKPNGC